MPLSLTLGHGDAVLIGENIVVRYYRRKGQCNLIVAAPKEFKISRQHLTYGEKILLKKKEGSNGVGE